MIEDEPTAKEEELEQEVETLADKVAELTETLVEISNLIDKSLR